MPTRPLPTSGGKLQKLYNFNLQFYCLEQGGLGVCPQGGLHGPQGGRPQADLVVILLPCIGKPLASTNDLI